MRIVPALLLRSHAGLVGLRHPPRKFVLHRRLAPTQKDLRRGLLELLQIAHALVVSFVIKGIEPPVEPEEAAEKRRIDELGKRIQLVNAVFERRACQHERIRRREPLEVAGGLRLPVLNALRLIKDHEIRLEDVVDLLPVADDLLVVGDEEECFRRRIPRKPHMAHPIQEFRLGIGEKPYLILPFALERRRHDHERALDPDRLAQEQRGGDRLNRFAEAHFVRQQRASLPSEMERAFALIRIERLLQERPLSVVALHLAELRDFPRDRLTPDKFREMSANLLGNAYRIGSQFVQPSAHANERVDSGGRAVLDDSSSVAVAGECAPSLDGHPLCGNEFRRVRIATHENLGAGRTPKLAAFPRCALHGALNVLARSKPALREVRAVARVDRLIY